MGQNESKTSRIEVFGQLATDMGYNFNQIDSAWFDVVRPTHLPSYKNEFAPNGNVFFSFRQTEFGIESFTELPKGELKGKFDFDLFGTGPNIGQTAIHFREAYVQFDRITVGQTMSPFMDNAVSPDILEYWGPPGRVFLRNIMIRYMPVEGSDHLAFALEMPGASADEGIYRNRIELKDVRPEFILPNLSADYRLEKNWGYVQLAGVAQWIKWVDTSSGPFDLGGHALTWGMNLSSNWHLSDADLLQAAIVYGEGIENYLTDATADIGLKKNFTNPVTPVLGVPLPVLGTMAFVKHRWSEYMSSSIGFSSVHISNSNAQTPDAFKRGEYAIANLLFKPVKPITVGAELQWGKRDNFTDGFSSHIMKIQLSCRYNFSQTFDTSKKA